MTTARTLRSRLPDLPWRFLIAVFLLAKILATVLGLIGLWTAQSTMDIGGLGHYQGNRVGPISMWFQWDARWYAELARTDWFAPLSDSARQFLDQARTDPGFRSGTPVELHRFAFPPLFPLLTKLLAGVLFGHEILAMTILVNLAFFGSLATIYLLGRELFGTERDARWSVLALAGMPMSFLFQAATTESLFLLLMLVAMLLGARRRWWAAASFGYLAALTRSTGFLLAAALVVLALGQRQWRFDASALRAYGRALPAVVAPVLGWLTFMAWCRWRTGDAMAYSHLQRAGWNVGLESPRRVFSDTFAADASPMLAVKLAVIAAMLLALVAGARTLPAGHVVLGLLLVLLPVSIGVQWPKSILRYLAVVYPVALVAVVAARRRPAVAPFLLVSGTVLQAGFLLVWCWSFTFQII